MKRLDQLLPSISMAHAAISVSALVLDSREVRTGMLFIALKGSKHDARDWIDDVIAKGAAAVFAEKDAKWSEDVVINGVPVVVVESLPQKLGEIAARFFDEPSKNLRIMAVTGTNGKTSSSQLLAATLTQLGHRAAVLGTLGNGMFGALEASTHTTLDACHLQALLAQFVAEKAGFVAMEASSHGLEQGRLNGTQIEVGIFTNLTRDHLDYHGTMESYAAAKEILFRWPSLKKAVLNADDPVSVQYAAVLSSDVTCWQYSLEAESKAEVVARKISLSLHGLTVLVSTPVGECEIKAPLLGRFNVSNLLAVMTTLLLVDMPLADIAEALRSVKPVAGRMESYMGDHPTVVVDYAHTPDALEKVLTSLREHVEGNLICVFGCGGDRDKGKRPVMGRIASELADKVVLTSDNPRTESPADILVDIKAGVVTGSVIVESDRHRAIAEAVAGAGRRDIVVIAGKGHEDYQEVAGVRHPFNDAQEVRAALAVWRAA